MCSVHSPLQSCCWRQAEQWRLKTGELDVGYQNHTEIQSCDAREDCENLFDEDLEGEADAASESGAVLGEGANRGDEDVADLGDVDDPSDEDGVTLAAVLAEEVDSDLTAVLAVIWLGEVNVVGDVAVASDVALAFSAQL